ncbi:hypothetical protein Taro_038084 [Colocasia esculenta]|uniref:Uncharacterized protein n=1 Tax=Colocasia esculenta TaxID=4460 RepID=A0A843WET0_COLES|nr:hypothetical protein [Colocasia esculenta]
MATCGAVGEVVVRWGTAAGLGQMALASEPRLPWTFVKISGYHSNDMSGEVYSVDVYSVGRFLELWYISMELLVYATGTSSLEMFWWKAIKGGNTIRTPGLSFPDGFHVHLFNKALE